MSSVWATVFALVYQRISHYWPGTLAIWVGVLSHWVLDWITHRPDMPLYPGGPRFGLGLWNSIAGTMVVEILMLAIGVWLYARITHGVDRVGRYGFVAYVACLLVLYVGDRFSAPPTSVAEIMWTGIIAEAFLIPWAWWFDDHRVFRSALQ